MDLFRFYLSIKSLFVKKPTKKLTWSVTDFKIGKKWSSTQSHPYLKNKTLWDYCNDKQDSVYTIQNLNRFI